MNIYKHKKNQLLYEIEHLIHDIRFTNRNANAGIYANPYLPQDYNNPENKIIFLSRNHQECINFVNENFEPIAYR